MTGGPLFAMRRFRLAAVLVFLVLVLSIASFALALTERGPVLSTGTLFALEMGSLLVLTLAALIGPVLGTGFGSVVFVFVGIGLPVAGFGALSDWLLGAQAADVAGLLSLLSVGVGFCLAAPGHRDRTSRFILFGLALLTLGVGTRGMFGAFGLEGVMAVAAPYLGAAILALALRPLAAPAVGSPSRGTRT